MASIVLRDVVKRYGVGSPVIAGVNLEIRDHELMVLTGPNGCGKSTLLRMIAGLEQVTSGTISMDGRVVNDVLPKDRDIALVCQSYALYPHLSVRENLEFGPKLRGVPRPEIDRLVGETARALDIEPYLERRPQELSEDERLRVALGRAVVRRPAAILFDEPLSNFEARLRARMGAALRKQQKRLRVTSVYVTHDQIETTMGDRVAILRAGVLIQVGTPLELEERPADIFVASSSGTPPVSFIRATVTDGGRLLSATGFALSSPPDAHEVLRARAGKPVVIGVRPKHVLLGDRDPRGPSAALELTTDVVEVLGDQAVVHASLGDESFAFKVDARRRPELGEKVEVTIELEGLLLFDAETEKRIVY